MTKKLLPLLIGLLFPLFSIGQDVPKKIAKQICKCLEKEEVTSLEDIDPCFEKVLVKNFENLYKFYDVETIDEINFDKLGAEIAVLLSKECDYFIPYLTDPINKFEEDFVPEKNLVCTELHAGDYYYLTPNPFSKQRDTTFVTIRDNMYLERMEAGRTYSLLDINWLSDCQFELVFNNSNDLVKNALSKKGDSYNYEMVSSTSSSFIIKMTFNDQIYKFELFKTE